MAHERVTAPPLTILLGLARAGAEAQEVGPLIDRVSELVADAFGASVVLTHLLESDGLSLARKLTRGGEAAEVEGEAERCALDLDTVFGRAALLRRPIAAELDAPPSSQRHRVAAPLVVKDELIGTLCVARERPLSEEEVELLESCAAQTAVAIAHARLLEHERRRVRDLRLLLDVGRAVTGSLDLGVILQASAESLTRIVEASHSFILLLDETTGVLSGAATSSAQYREQFRGVRIRVDEASLAAKCVRDRRPVAASDARGAPDAHQGLVELYNERSVLALPLLVRDEPIGALVIGDTRGARVWNDAEIERATLISHHVAVAVANARLFADLKQSYADLGRAQEELVKRERLAALGELAAVVAHEVRNPLGVIFNSLGTLTKIVRPEGDAEVLMRILQEEADRLNALVGDLLDFTRPTALSIQAESLANVIAAAVEAAEREPAARGVTTVVDVDPELPLMHIDARMMRQALINLVLNGMQSMPGGGSLEVRARLDRAGERRLARIDVRDAGPGIPMDHAAQIFQPFFTTKATGTGLGLALVKRIVEAHKGEIAYESGLRGTTFTVLLPIEPDPARAGSDRPRSRSSWPVGRNERGPAGAASPD